MVVEAGSDYNGGFAHIISGKERIGFRDGLGDRILDSIRGIGKNILPKGEGLLLRAGRLIEQNPQRTRNKEVG